jgi:hypothetical protein
MLLTWRWIHAFSVGGSENTVTAAKKHDSITLHAKLMPIVKV